MQLNTNYSQPYKHFVTQKPLSAPAKSHSSALNEKTNEEHSADAKRSALFLTAAELAVTGGILLGGAAYIYKKHKTAIHDFFKPKNVDDSVKKKIQDNDFDDILLFDEIDNKLKKSGADSPNPNNIFNKADDSLTSIEKHNSQHDYYDYDPERIFSKSEYSFSDTKSNISRYDDDLSDCESTFSDYDSDGYFSDTSMDDFLD